MLRVSRGSFATSLRVVALVGHGDDAVAEAERERSSVAEGTRLAIRIALRLIAGL